ncbi:MAG: carbon-phosphorus lyase complex subunit PhnI [Spirochaetaceae bacterium]|jgi:alpha-D-ribose 1-methylphosphonate 5-triphosphate synthase subunit PhnI|nr:carbon-phosphorus lyase complex subunit PhnI [Spirochaetaceae bacterium]
MAYVAVKGGREAVAESIKLLEKHRAAGPAALDPAALKNRMSFLIDRIMGEAGFYAPAYAVLALIQSAGSPEEAVFLLRAYRSTLARSYLSLPLDGADMTIHRRVSAAFKDIPGGQFLGAAFDYTHRLLNFDLLNPESAESGDQAAAGEPAEGESPAGEAAPGPIHARRVSEELRREGLISAEMDESEPWDITEDPLSFPAPRSARLQTLARSDTGYISGLAYAAIRGFGSGHPTVGELRTGTLEVTIPHPLVEGECLFVGDLMVTEVESLFSGEDQNTGGEAEKDPLKILSSGQGDRADHSRNALSIAAGYGLVFGRNDTKAIAMSILDYSLDKAAICNTSSNTSPSAVSSSGSENGGLSVLGNQEFVLLHGDALEMNGFISHLKLPHYVTFQSKLDRVRHTHKKADHDRL